MATVSALHVKGDVIEHYIRARKSMSKKKKKKERKLFSICHSIPRVMVS